jgi:hypothetical protein
MKTTLVVIQNDAEHADADKVGVCPISDSPPRNHPAPDNARDGTSRTPPRQARLIVDDRSVGKPGPLPERQALALLRHSNSNLTTAYKRRSAGPNVTKRANASASPVGWSFCEPKYDLISRGLTLVPTPAFPACSCRASRRRRPEDIRRHSRPVSERKVWILV